jgi:hypothetical protein
VRQPLAGYGAALRTPAGAGVSAVPVRLSELIRCRAAVNSISEIAGTADSLFEWKLFVRRRC